MDVKKHPIIKGGYSYEKRRKRSGVFGRGAD